MLEPAQLVTVARACTQGKGQAVLELGNAPGVDRVCWWVRECLTCVAGVVWLLTDTKDTRHAHVQAVTDVVVPLV